jgi:hypothetical protein
MATARDGSSSADAADAADGADPNAWCGTESCDPATQYCDIYGYCGYTSWGSGQQVYGEIIAYQCAPLSDLACADAGGDAAVASDAAVPCCNPSFVCSADSAGRITVNESYSNDCGCYGSPPARRERQAPSTSVDLPPAAVA